MLDLLEASLTGLRPTSAPAVAVTSAEALRAEMQEGDVTVGEAAESLGVSRATIEEWLAGTSPAPLLALTTLQLLRRIAVSERRTISRDVPAPAPPVIRAAPQPVSGKHPFSRIEEL